MRTEIIVEKVKHYHMSDSQFGCSVIVRGNQIENGNEFGVDITESPIVNYGELPYLKSIKPDAFPAKFKADIEFTKVKDKNGKEKTGIGFKNLEYVCKMVMTEEKISKSV